MAKNHTQKGFIIAEISMSDIFIKSIINNLYEAASIGIANRSTCLNSSLRKNVSFIEK